MIQKYTRSGGEKDERKVFRASRRPRSRTSLRDFLACYAVDFVCTTLPVHQCMTALIDTDKSLQTVSPMDSYACEPQP
jgi:hypothetical protein